MRDFKKLLIWQKAMEVVTETYRAVEGFPEEEGQRLSKILNLIMEEQRMLSSFLDKLKAKA